ncbi:MAG: SH3 domain-containing protein [Saccharofermentans sp.]|nr:SH3 domain-containing protein [Saccharofermentans sp.]
MKRNTITKILCISLAAVMLMSMAACGKKKKDAKPSEETDAAPTPIPVETTAATTSSIPVWSGPLESNTISVTWSETEFDSPTTKYAGVTAGEFLRIRSGPSVDYEIVGTLSRNQPVVVVAVTSDGWYKTSDGFYISGTYLTDTQSA